MSPFSMSGTLHKSTGAPLVRLSGEVDVTTRGLGPVLGALAARKPPLLLVDLSALSFLDCAALNVVVRAHQELQSAGCELALVGPSNRVVRLLELTRTDEVLRIYATADEAGAAARRLDPGGPA